MKPLFKKEASLKLPEYKQKIMIKKFLSDEKRLRKHAFYFKSLILFSFILLTILLWRTLKEKWLYDPDKNLAFVYPKEERNIRKFYQNFEAPEVGEKVKLFKLKDLLSGKIFDLGTPRNYWLLLIFENTGCPTCISMEKELSDLKKAMRDKLQIVTIGAEKNAEKISSYKKEYNVNRLWLYDEKALVSLAFRVKVIPALFLIDKDNVLRYKHEGFTEQQEIIKVIEKGN